MKNSVLLILFCWNTLASYAQNDTAELKILLAVVQNAYDKHPDSLEYYADKALAMAQRTNNIEAETRIQKLRGAKLFLDGEFDKGVKIYLDAIRKAEKHPPFPELALIYFELAGAYSKNNYMDISNGYILKGINIATQLNDKRGLADGCNRLGIYYERIGKIDSALGCYERALVYDEQAGDILGKAYSIENIAEIYGKQGDLQKALRYQREALANMLLSGNKYGKAIVEINIADTYAKMKKYDSAVNCAMQAIELTKEINFKDGRQYLYQFLSEIYQRKGDYKTSLSYHQKYSELHDSLFNEMSTKQLGELNTKYQTEKKEQQIKTLHQQSLIQNLQIKQKNTWLFIAAGLLIVGSVISYLIYNRRKLKEKTRLQEEINRQQEITAREVLNAEEKERRRIAGDLHDGVGQLLSASLMNLNSLFKKLHVNPETDQLADRTLALVNESYDELRSVSHQMMPNALIKAGLANAVKELIYKIDQDKISVNLEVVGVGDRLEEQVETVLYRVIQEVINNVIKHAKANKLSIQLIKDEEGIFVNIEDNGLGFDSKKAGENGIGLKNMLSRIQFLKGILDIDSSPGKGTLVAIYIPV